MEARMHTFIGIKEIKVSHGEIGHPMDEHFNMLRKCNICGWHTPIYVCKYYSRYTKNLVKKVQVMFREARSQSMFDVLCHGISGIKVIRDGKYGSRIERVYPC